MRTVTLEELLEAGCHFGHQVTRQNPKTKDFVFEARDNIHIIDLEKTKEGLEIAAAFVKKIAEKTDSSILLLGTKRQAQEIIRDEVQRVTEENINHVFNVTTRWIGGTFTNFSEVMKNYKKLKDLTQKLKDEFEKMKYTKKEISLWDKERAKLESFYGGTKEMTRIPDLIYIIDTHTERQAVNEARLMSVPIVGIVDTNADPDPINYPIPANDDASGSIKLITNYIIDAWIEGKKKSAKSEGESFDTAPHVAEAMRGKQDKKVKGEEKMIKETKEKEETESAKSKSKKVESIETKEKEKHVAAKKTRKRNTK